MAVSLVAAVERPARQVTGRARALHAYPIALGAIARRPEIPRAVRPTAVAEGR
ncbi:hypothetical protein AB0K74_35275 [Streptomyces sp. NPDC056159]|uniref:hypothetical protein n=1 Tax=unclassified Streptomyces TaxID=2593676 RepID=UPI003419F381